MKIVAGFQDTRKNKVNMEHENLNNQESPQLGIGVVSSSTYHQGINDSIKTIESILDYKSNTKWGRALSFAVNQIESLKKETWRLRMFFKNVTNEKSTTTAIVDGFFKDKLTM